MTELARAVNAFNRLSSHLGYEVSPPYMREIKNYDFGRGITIEQPAFWEQYGAMLRISNGLCADGYTFYGIAVGDEPGLFEFNEALNIPGFESECMQYRIEVGSNNMDTLYYDTRTRKWEACDRIGTDHVWASCDSLAQLIQTQVDMLRESWANEEI